VIEIDLTLTQFYTLTIGAYEPCVNEEGVR